MWQVPHGMERRTTSFFLQYKNAILSAADKVILYQFTHLHAMKHIFDVN